MTVIVTGAAGFIGANFVAAARAADWRVVSVDAFTYAGLRENLAPFADDPGHRLVEADICDADAMRELLRAEQPDALVNLAAQSHVDRSTVAAAPFFRTNAEGVAVLLEVCGELARAGALPGGFRVVQVSTDEVFGDTEPGAPFDEDSPYRPSSPYAASKAAGDMAVQAFQRTHGVPVVLAHASNTYGPRQLPEKLIPLAIARALAGAPIPIYGDGRQARDWLHVADHCAALRALATHGAPGEAVCLGTGRTTANLDLVGTLCAILDRRAPRADGAPYARQIAHVADRPGHDRCYALDPTRAAQRLGWRAQTDLAAGLDATVAWYLDHPDWLDAARDRAETPGVHPVEAADAPRTAAGGAS